MLMLRSISYLALSVVMLLLATATTVLAENHRHVLAAQLLGVHEVPSINSPGSGDIKLTIHDTSIDFELSYADLSAPPLFAHIHFAEARVAGGVLVFLCGGGGTPACPAATSGTITGTLTGPMVIGPTAQGVTIGDFDALVNAIRDGAAYANMHTLNFPAGEIRGQIHPTPLHK